MARIKCLDTRKVRSLSTTRAGVGPVVRRDRGRAWMRLRQVVLDRDGYLCQHCAARGVVELAREVDHVVPLHLGGADHEDNLQSLCVACHQAKSADEERERRGDGG